MHDQRMKPRVAGQYFPGISGCRVTVKYALYVFANTDVTILNLFLSYGYVIRN